MATETVDQDPIPPWAEGDVGPACFCGTDDTHIAVTENGVWLVCDRHLEPKGDPDPDPAAFRIDKPKPANWPNLSEQEVKDLLWGKHA